MRTDLGLNIKRNYNKNSNIYTSEQMQSMFNPIYATVVMGILSDGWVGVGLGRGGELGVETMHW